MSNQGSISNKKLSTKSCELDTSKIKTTSDINRGSISNKIDKILVNYFDENDGVDWDGGRKAIKSLLEETLDDYSNKLNKWGYIDSDYYTEEPTAVKRYLTEVNQLESKEGK